MCEALPKVKKPLTLNRTHASIYFVPFVSKLTRKSVSTVSVVWTGRVLSVNLCWTYRLNLSHIDFNAGKQTLSESGHHAIDCTGSVRLQWRCCVQNRTSVVLSTFIQTHSSLEPVGTLGANTTNQNLTGNKLKCILGLISASWLPPPAVTPSIYDSRNHY